MSTEQWIDLFVRYFGGQITYVASLRGDDSIVVESRAIHRKILYSAILDCLAGIRYWGQRLGNRQRFLKLLEEHADWEEGKLVSVPILMTRLRGIAGPPGPSPLQSRLLEILSSYGIEHGDGLPLSAFDKSLTELSPLASTRGERALLKETTHRELFYRYRNFTVHEFREPGYGMELFAAGGEEPLYHSYVGAYPPWKLLYPEGFFRARARSALNSLERYLRDNGINPYDRVRDSEDWVSAHNEGSSGRLTPRAEPPHRWPSRVRGTICVSQ